MERELEEQLRDTIRRMTQGIDILNRKTYALKDAIRRMCEQDSAGNWHERGCGGMCHKKFRMCAEIRMLLRNDA